MNVTKKITDTFTWAASSDVEVALPTEGLITRIDFELYLTAGSAISSELSTYGLCRAIENFKIVGGGGKQYFSLVGKHMGILWHYLNLLDFPGKSFRDIVATSQYIAFRCHFGSRQRDIYGRDNPFDLSAAIPAMDETNLNVIWTTGAAADTIDNDQDISAATMRMTVHEVLNGERNWNRLVPVSSCETYNPGGTKDNLGGEVDIPTGKYVRRIVMMCQDASALNAGGRLIVGDQVTELGVRLVKPQNTQLIYVRSKQLELNNPKFDGMQVVDTPNTLSPWSCPGFYCLDLRPYKHADYGYDTKNLRKGDLKLGMTIDSYASADREYIWYDQLESYAG